MSLCISAGMLRSTMHHASCRYVGNCGACLARHIPHLWKCMDMMLLPVHMTIPVGLLLVRGLPDTCTNGCCACWKGKSAPFMPPHRVSQRVSTPWPVVTSSSRMIRTASTARMGRLHIRVSNQTQKVCTSPIRMFPQQIPTHICEHFWGVRTFTVPNLQALLTESHRSRRDDHTCNAAVPCLCALSPAPLPHAHWGRQHAAFPVICLQDVLHPACIMACA